MRGRFVVQDGRNPGAPLRLFCFPYAGAGASCFRRLQGRLQPLVDVVRIQLPGREERLDERPYDEPDELVEALSAELEPLVRGGVAFLGYSLGALLAFETARTLQRAARPLQQLLACASAAPATLMPEADSDDSDDALLQRLRDLGATPPRLLEDHAAMRVLLPAVRADFRLLERYCYEPGPPLRCSIHAVGGERDAAVSRANLQAWSAHTRARCEVSLLAGDHFFIHSAAESFHELVLASLGFSERATSPLLQQF